MPLNTLRLNHQASSHPNERIVFIKPLPRPSGASGRGGKQAGVEHKDDYATAELVLKAIVAQCLPVMKGHYLSVTTLEEHEPNREFIGRNFNNGEIIQLVLRTYSGGWMPFHMVQMVMMHELAHNVHMNHSRAFWATRNLFAEEMRALWTKGYTGEGLWGKGHSLNARLGDALSDQNTIHSEELASLPLCGGTFRSRGRRRKRKGKGESGGEELTWKEKRDRRIEKKFGKNGVSLGEDEDKRLALEFSKRGPVGVKPRVAQSKRGRELRAAAALARFDTNKREVTVLEASEMKEEDVKQEEEYEEYEEVDEDENEQDAKDINGKDILDGQGRKVVRVCEEEGADDIQVKQEMDELENLDWMFPFTRSSTSTESKFQVKQEEKEQTKNATTQEEKKKKQAASTGEKVFSVGKKKPNSGLPPSDSVSKIPSTIRTSEPSNSTKVETKVGAVSQPPHNVSTTPVPPTAEPTLVCPICSLENPCLNATCLACAHVLDPRKDPRSWKCQSDTCHTSGSQYANAGDCGVCGVCGSRRAKD